MPRVIAVGLGPAGPELLTAETQALLAWPCVRLRTARHPAAEALDIASYDHVYESADSFDDVYATIVEDLVDLAGEMGEVVYAVPGSPLVAEKTIELLRVETRVTLDVRPALSFLDLAWTALGIDPMQERVTIVDAHRFIEDAAGRSGPLLVTQVHSSDVAADIADLCVDADASGVVLLARLGLADASVESVEPHELATIDADHLTSLWIQHLGEPVAAEFARFDEMMRELRDRCPWDAAQTHGSLRRFLVEETYEVLEALDAVSALEDDGPLDVADDAYADLEEELGDLLFQIFFHARLAAEQGRFTVSDVARGIFDKLYSRHPHVFGDANADEAIASWDSNKQSEKGRESALDGVPAAMPSLLRAMKLQSRASNAGFGSNGLEWAIGDIADELAEFTADPSEAELGDVLFALVQAARSLGADPEAALAASNNRYAKRFRWVEQAVKGDGRTIAELSRAETEDLWSQAKAAG